MCPNSVSLGFIGFSVHYVWGIRRISDSQDENAETHSYA